MRVWLVPALVALGAACSHGAAAPCDMSVDDNVDHLVSVVADEAAWDEWAIELADGCPAKHLLVGERLAELGKG
jgi:hypothetical protein